MSIRASPITDQKSKPEDRSSRSWEILIWIWAQDQDAGGGRINWVVAGRKIGEDSATRIARTAVTRTGAEAGVWVLIPALAVAQIEQVWRDAVEFSECEWVACTVH